MLKGDGVGGEEEEQVSNLESFRLLSCKFGNKFGVVEGNGRNVLRKPVVPIAVARQMF